MGLDTGTLLVRVGCLDGSSLVSMNEAFGGMLYSILGEARDAGGGCT